jgi:hypothetical protein
MGAAIINASIGVSGLLPPFNVEDRDGESHTSLFLNIVIGIYHHVHDFFWNEKKSF